MAKTKTSLRRQIEARKADRDAIARTIRSARFFTKASPFAQAWDGSRLPEDRA